MVSVVHGLYVSLQDLIGLTDDDLQDLGKRAGVNWFKRRDLIKRVKKLRKV